ncbi:hypothetical protein PILCRDRAFT_8001 [Piloderma croceum F 1598]|uniref:Uncharacterized protein n=1 Tax=Piloderma croceum (strain F 1598) TaxID=765440 RepID=A0A0C3FTI1_PILCF|nr:hypothetical protein PILCRDRAFT_8001 [Piloderma croceum F 1598]
MPEGVMVEVGSNSPRCAWPLIAASTHARTQISSAFSWSNSHTKISNIFHETGGHSGYLELSGVRFYAPFSEQTANRSLLIVSPAHSPVEDVAKMQKRNSLMGRR